jgi:hypothetical protein
MRSLYTLASIALAVFNSALAQTNTVISGNLPQGVLNTVQLADDEKEYCDDHQNKNDCHEAFRANLSWRELRITPSGTVSILVEDKNNEFCGSGGCSLYLFLKRSDGIFVQILGDGDIGDLTQVGVLKSVTNGYYDLQKTRADGKTHDVYRWQGRRYVVQ